jgi:hypothetical protein
VKKLAILGMCAVIITPVLAQRMSRAEILERRRADERRSRTIREIKDLSLEVSILTASRLATVKHGDLRAIEDALRSARNILRGDVVRPVPVPPPVREKYLSCDAETNNNADIATKRKITKMIDDVADDYLGMNYREAEQFARAWMQEYPCSVAKQYVVNAKLLNEVSDDHMGLNYVTAAEYAKNNVEKLCPGVDVISQARQINDYADDDLGMNYVEADRYTLNWVQENMLTCQMPKTGDFKL